MLVDGMKAGSVMVGGVLVEEDLDEVVVEDMDEVAVFEAGDVGSFSAEPLSLVSPGHSLQRGVVGVSVASPMIKRSYIWVNVCAQDFVKERVWKGLFPNKASCTRVPSINFLTRQI